MSKTIFTLLLLCVLNVCNSQDMNIMLVTGGHSFDTLQFFKMFDQLDGIEYEHFSQPKANRYLTTENVGKFDVLVFYDMWKEIDECQKKAYVDLTKAGKPFLFLHHSIASYQDWPEFERIIGGKYIEPGDGIDKTDFSTYEHDVWINYKSIKKCSITEGLDTFRLFDEVYGNVKMGKDIIPLISTDHPKSSQYVAWENSYNNSTILYLQPGHDSRAYADPNYRQLIAQSIKYLVNKK